MDPQIFSRLLLLVLGLNLTVSAYYRHRARAQETIPRSAEPVSLRLARATFGLPWLILMVAFVVNPAWTAWASMDLPAWARLLGVALGLALVPMNAWILRSLGKNVSETVLTKKSHELVDRGPYRWVRHPLYSTGFLLLSAISVIAKQRRHGSLDRGRHRAFSARDHSPGRIGAGAKIGQRL